MDIVMEELEKFFFMLILSVLVIYIFGKLFTCKSVNNINGGNRIVEDNENYIRLLTCVNYAGRIASLDILFDPTYGLPRCKKKLYQKLLLVQSTFDKLKKKGKIGIFEWDILYPQSKETHFEEFDISLIYKIIRNCTGLPPPRGGWKINKPHPHDQSIAAYLILLRQFRNALAHFNGKHITDVEFQQLWSELMSILKGLNYDITLVNDLKDCSLDAKQEYRYAVFTSQIDMCINKIEDASEIADKSWQNLNRKMSTTSKDIKQLQSSFAENAAVSQSEIKKNEAKLITTRGELYKIRLEVDAIKGKKQHNQKSGMEPHNRSVSSIYKRILKVESDAAASLEVTNTYIKDSINRNVAAAISKHQVVVKESSGDNNGVAALFEPMALTSIESTSTEHLQELNLSGQPLSIAKVDVFTTGLCNSNFYLLDDLNLSDCNLSDLHLKHLSELIPLLVSINLDSNKSITHYGWNHVWNGIYASKCHRLMSMSVADCNIQDAELISLEDIIPCVKTFDLSSNKSFTHIGLKHVVESICSKSNILLENLQLNDCDLTDSHLGSMADLIPFVKTVGLETNCRISEKGYTILSDSIANSETCCIEKLSLCNCNIGDTELDAIINLLPHLDELDMDDNTSITEAGFLKLSSVVCNNRRINLNYFSLHQFSELQINSLLKMFPYFKQFLIPKTSSGSFNIKSLHDAINNSNCCTLKSGSIYDMKFTKQQLLHLLHVMSKAIDLDMYNCASISAFGVEYIYGIKNSIPKFYITSLTLNNCNVTESCMEILANLSSCINTLDLSNNQRIPAESIQYFLGYFESYEQRSLTSISFTECCLTSHHLLELGRIIPYLNTVSLERNYAMQPSDLKKMCNSILKSKVFVTEDLNFSYCGFEDAQVAALCDVFLMIENISLNGNKNITTTGWRYLADSICSTNLCYLRFLYLDDCNITDSDLKAISPAFPLLTRLTVNRNKSLRADGLKYLSFCVSTAVTNSLEELNLSDCNIKDIHIDAMADMIPLLQRIDLSMNGTLNNNALECLSLSISKTSSFNLELLVLSSCNLTDHHMKSFFAAPLVKELDLSENKLITPEGWGHLSSTVMDSPTLILDTLILRDCNLNTNDVKAMAGMIPLITYLCIDNNRLLSAECLEEFSHIIADAMPIKCDRISVANCNLNDYHLIAMRDIYPMLRWINISDNTQITKYGLSIISEVLSNSSNAALKEFYFNNCKIGEEEVIAVKPILPHLDCLWFEDRSISSTAFAAISTILDSFTGNLKEVSFIDANIKDEQLESMLKMIPSLECLDISFNRFITSIGYKQLSCAIISSRLPKIQSINLEHCNIVDSDLAALSELIPLIKIIKLGNNRSMTAVGFQKVAKCICNAQRLMLESLYLQNCNLLDSHLKVLKYAIATITTVDISFNYRISPNGWKELTECCCSSAVLKLEALYASDCNIKREHLKEIFPLMVLVKEVDISGRLDQSSLNYISKLICNADERVLEKISVLSLNCNEFHIQGMLTMALLLKEVQLNNIKSLPPSAYSRLLKSLDTQRIIQLDNFEATNCNLSNDHMASLGEMTRYISKMDLSHNKMISSDGFKSFARYNSKSLEEGKRLKGLILKNCHLTDLKLQKMDVILKQVEYLDLSLNKTIGPLGIGNLNNAISSAVCFGLKHLDLSDCDITQHHLKRMASLIPLLKVLILDDNKTLLPCDYSYLSQVVNGTNPKNLELISLQNCGLNDTHLKEIFSFIACLKEVELSNNPRMTAQGFKDACEHLDNGESSNLQKLYLADCKMTSEHIESIKHIIPTLTYLELDRNTGLTADTFTIISGQLNQVDESSLERVTIQNCNISDSHMKEMSNLLHSITTLDLSSQYSISSDGLKHISDAVLEIKYSKLESLKVSNFGRWNGFPLQSVCSMVPLLKEVDISSCIIMEDGLTAVSEEVASATKNKLETLKLRQVNITISHLHCMNKLIPLLKKLDINQVKSLTPDCMSFIGDLLISSNHRNLQCLVLKECNLTDNHMRCMTNVIQSLLEIDVSNNKRITPDGWKQLAQDIITSKNKGLSKLSVCDCNISDRHLHNLSPAIPFIKEVDLSYNKTILPTSLKYISKAVSKSNPCMKILHFKDCNLSESHFEEMKDMLCRVQHLDISENVIMYPKDLRFLNHVKLSSEENIVETVSLCNCNLKDIHIRSISKMAPLLKTLDVSKNRLIIPSGFKHLSNVVIKSTNCRLEELVVKDCNLTDRHLEVISTMVPFLKKVDLSKNKLITPLGLLYITERVTSADISKLEEIGLSKCNISDAHLESMYELLPYLQRLVLNNNRHITTEGVIRASEKLESFFRRDGFIKLKELNLTKCLLRKSRLTTLSKWNMFVEILI